MIEFKSTTETTLHASRSNFRLHVMGYASLLTVVMLGLPHVSHASKGSSQRPTLAVSQCPGKLVPDINTRKSVAGVRADQIASLSFPRIETGVAIESDDTVPTVDPNLSITITKPKVIRQFLRGLHHAVEFSPNISAIEGPAELTLSFRQSGGRHREDIRLEVNSVYFGPEFRQAFDHLPQLLARETRHKAHIAAGHTVAINMVGTHVTDPDQVSRIINALGYVTEKAFNLRFAPQSSIEIVLLLRNGRVSKIDLAPYSATSDSLPADLLKYYKSVLRSQQTVRTEKINAAKLVFWNKCQTSSDLPASYAGRSLF